MLISFLVVSDERYYILQLSFRYRGFIHSYDASFISLYLNSRGLYLTTRGYDHNGCLKFRKQLGQEVMHL